METGHTPFFSIVMPAYGVEAYIRQAIESVLNQTYSNFELLVVDDATPDNSGRIAEELAAKDRRIQVLHHETNRGLSEARNTGLAHAVGEYIWFMDSDDTIESSLLERVFSSLQENAAQLVIFGLVEEYYDKAGQYAYSHSVVPKEACYAAANELRQEIIFLERDTLYGYAWNKIYKLSYLREIGLKFETVTLIEDILFNVKYCMDITSMNTISYAGYHYAKRLENSLTNKYVPDYYKLHEQRIDLIFKQYQYWGMATVDVRAILGGLYGRYVFSAIQRNCDKRANMTHIMRIEWCRNVFSRTIFKELIPHGKATESKSLSLLLFLLQKKMIRGSLLMGRVIYCIRTYLPMLYSNVKSGR